MEETNYPLPAFHFEVKWSNEDTDAVPFSEVSGLSVEHQVIEYRNGNSKEFSTIKMPGLRKYGNVTLKRGALAKDNSLFDWWDKAKLNQIERRNVVISLLDEEHEPVITWQLQTYLTDDKSLKNRLIADKVFVPTYWPNVFHWCHSDDWEYYLAERTVFIPVDQRYSQVDLQRVIQIITGFC